MNHFFSRDNIADLIKKTITATTLIFIATSFQANAASLAELEKQHALYVDLVRDPNVVLVPIPITSQNYDIFPPCFDTQRGWYKKNELEDRIQRCLLDSPHQPTDQAYEAFFTLIQMGSNKEKNYLIQNDIPQLETQIAQLRASSVNWQNPKPINPSQVTQFDPGWDGCPPQRPGNRSVVKYYPNNQNTGRTYLECKYFTNGAINYEKKFVNGKLEGKVTVWNQRNGVHYVSNRSNYKNGQLHGMKEYYMYSNSYGVFRQKLTTYANGQQHGDSAVWWDNGNLKSETNFFQGKPTKANNYRQDGSFSYCTKWGNDGRPRDCQTGNLR